MTSLYRQRRAHRTSRSAKLREDAIAEIRDAVETTLNDYRNGKNKSIYTAWSRNAAAISSAIERVLLYRGVRSAVTHSLGSTKIARVYTTFLEPL